MTATRAQLVALQEKYRLLTALHGDREKAQGVGLDSFDGTDRAARRAAMRSLAEKFPGALRELDDSTTADLSDSIDGDRGALNGGPHESWVEAMALFHEVLREALAIRRETPTRVAQGSRMLDEIWKSVAARMRLTPQEVERLVYPRTKRPNESDRAT